MAYDPTNRKDIRRAEKEAAVREAERVNYLKAAMTVPQGRAWFYDLLEFCGCFRGDVAADTHQTYFALGMRNVGLRMFNDITVNCPDDYIKMMKEANGRRIERDARDNRDADSSTARERSSGEDSLWGDNRPSGEPADNDAAGEGE